PINYDEIPVSKEVKSDIKTQTSNTTRPIQVAADSSEAAVDPRSSGATIYRTPKWGEKITDPVTQNAMDELLSRIQAINKSYRERPRDRQGFKYTGTGVRMKSFRKNLRV